MAEVFSLNGLPAKALKRRRALEAFLPSLRADYQINDTYVPTVDTPLDCPVHAYAADGDPVAGPDDVAGWRHATTGTFRLRVFVGDHFYLRDAPPVLTEAILADLHASAASRPAFTGREGCHGA
jgi:medium-chain acyl-[acyl-carrier-protein] hydrolase